MLRRQPKKVWYGDVRWDVEKIYSPSKYEDFLVLSRKNPAQGHQDGTTVTNMVLVDCHNDEWYPCSQKTDRLMIKKRAQDSAAREVARENEQTLKDIWLGAMVSSFDLEEKANEQA